MFNRSDCLTEVEAWVIYGATRRRILMVRIRKKVTKMTLKSITNFFNKLRDQLCKMLCILRLLYLACQISSVWKQVIRSNYFGKLVFPKCADLGSINICTCLSGSVHFCGLFSDSFNSSRLKDFHVSSILDSPPIPKVSAFSSGGYISM